MARKTSQIIKEPTESQGNYLSKLESDLQSNQSKVSLVLGALIVLVLGILVFNYFNKGKADLGPAQQTAKEETDVSPLNLPGNYTVKEGDTLFTIAEKYYQDGYKFEDLAKENNLSDVNSIEIGQSLKIPKLQEQVVKVEPAQTEELPAVGGGNTTIWGTRIEGNTYTVVEGDWLSKIAGRAYGDILAYQKLAEANNIANPDLIEPGMVLTIPR